MAGEIVTLPVVDDPELVSEDEAVEDCATVAVWFIPQPHKANMGARTAAAKESLCSLNFMDPHIA